MKVNVLEAKTRLSELIRSAQAGEDIVIANRGRPVVRLVPVREAEGVSGGRGSARGIVEWIGANPLPRHARRRAAEIDSQIQGERRAWD